jgi:hypothetical protein
VDNRTIQRLLNENGFPAGPVDGIIGPKTAAATKRFQTAYNAGPWLALDGIPGPKTAAALEDLPQLSAHFTVAELRSKGNGNCYVDRELLKTLEFVREAAGGRPLTLISAYRDPAHNISVGGARHSMHVYGLAVDPDDDYCDVDEILALGVFSGVGRRHGRWAHGDLRHLSSENQTPLAIPQRPAQWAY